MASRMEDFMRHVAKHVPDAEVIHNPPPLSDSFRCLWHECGFETINSSEMVSEFLFCIMLEILGEFCPDI